MWKMAGNTHKFSNSEVQQLFENVAAALTLKGQNRFRIIAYTNASAAAEHATSEIYDLWQQGKLDDIPGFGEQIIDYLDELFRTGKVLHFEESFKGIKPATFEFLKLPGVGPKTGEKLAEAGIAGLSDLKERLVTDDLPKEVTPKLKETLKSGLKRLQKDQSTPKRMLLPYAAEIAEGIMSEMRKLKAVEEIHPLGSLRRKVATIGDVDFAVKSSDPKAVTDYFVSLPAVGKILYQCDAKASVVLKVGIRADLMVEPPQYFGSLLQHFTGSKMHNIHLRRLAKAKGLKLSETGITPAEGKDTKFDFDKELASAETEEGFYAALGMQWMPPEMREDAGEIEAALEHRVPRVVELTDIKGDLHLHSSYPIDPSHDLGIDSMQDLIKNAKERGYAYVNLTDHNPAITTHTENQIIDLIVKRKKFIEQLKSSSTIKLLNSLEIDILPTGELAVPEEGLKLMDVGICGVHSRHNMTRDDITKRVVKALENPYLKILVHPTNRLINKRDESDLDWDVILDVAKKYNKVLEINAFYDRLDLPDNLVREAISRGIKLAISTDSHAVKHMDVMQYGIDVARRGWATKADIVNTWDWPDFKKFFHIDY